MVLSNKSDEKLNPNILFLEINIRAKWTKKLKSAIFRMIFSIIFLDIEEKNKLWKVEIFNLLIIVYL